MLFSAWHALTQTSRLSNSNFNKYACTFFGDIFRLTHENQSSLQFYTHTIKLKWNRSVEFFQSIFLSSSQELILKTQFINMSWQCSGLSLSVIMF